MGPYNVDFTFDFDNTLKGLEITEIWPAYLAQAFLPPPPRNRQLRGPLGIGLKYHQKWFSDNQDIADIDKSPLDKYSLDKCHNYFVIVTI